MWAGWKPRHDTAAPQHKNLTLKKWVALKDPSTADMTNVTMEASQSILDVTADIECTTLASRTGPAQQVPASLREAEMKAVRCGHAQEKSRGKRGGDAAEHANTKMCTAEQVALEP